MRVIGLFDVLCNADDDRVDTVVTIDVAAIFKLLNVLFGVLVINAVGLCDGCSSSKFDCCCCCCCCVKQEVSIQCLDTLPPPFKRVQRQEVNLAAIGS